MGRLETLAWGAAPCIATAQMRSPAGGCGTAGCQERGPLPLNRARLRVCRRDAPARDVRVGPQACGGVLGRPVVARAAAARSAMRRAVVIAAPHHVVVDCDYASEASDGGGGEPAQRPRTHPRRRRLGRPWPGTSRGWHAAASCCRSAPGSGTTLADTASTTGWG